MQTVWPGTNLKFQNTVLVIVWIKLYIRIIDTKNKFNDAKQISVEYIIFRFSSDKMN